MSKTLLLVLISILSSCSSSEKGQTVRGAYLGIDESQEVGFSLNNSFLVQEKPVPVIYPPEIFAAYVPSHVDLERDMLIGEHWLFIKLTDSTWFIEKDNYEELKADEAGEDEKKYIVNMLKEPISKIVLPYQ